MNTKLDLTILKKIIEIESLSIKPVQTFNALRLIKQKLLSLKIPVQIINRQTFPVLIAGNLSNANNLFLSHIDVVPGNKNQFIFKQNGDKIFGRGSLDMKGPLIVSLTTFIFLWQKKIQNNIFVVTSDEEIGGFNGIPVIINKFLKEIRSAIILDSSSNEKIVLIQKAPFHIKIVSKGRSSHGSKPWEGVNSVENICKCSLNIVNAINKNSKTETSAAITQLYGGTATNVIPDKASSTIDIRIKNKKEIPEIVRLIDKLTKKQNCKWLRIDEPLFVNIPKNNEFINKWSNNIEFTVESGTSDARFLSEKNIPILITSASGNGAHTDNEWVSKSSLERLQNNLIKFLLE